MRSKHTISEERMKEFERREGDEVHQWIARQIDIATPFEGTWLYLMRSGDEKQRAAWDFHRAAVTARWSRAAVLVAAFGTLTGLAALFV